MKISFDSIQLKRIAVGLMLLDHIAIFFPGTPIFFRWIGRISMPLFVFCCACGFDYTHNRKKYIARLYFFSLITSFVQYVVRTELNFMRLLFSCTVLLEVIEKSKEDKKIWRYYIAWQIGAILILFFLARNFPDDGALDFLEYILTSLTGSVFFTEGGFCFVLLGVIFYYTFWDHSAGVCHIGMPGGYTKEGRKKLIVSFIVFDILYFLITQFPVISVLAYKMPHIYGWNPIGDSLVFVAGLLFGEQAIFTGGSPLFINFQWMMIAALPFIVFYNGKTRTVKKAEQYFYYCFYPLHLLVFNLI